MFERFFAYFSKKRECRKPDPPAGGERPPKRQADPKKE